MTELYVVFYFQWDQTKNLNEEGLEQQVSKATFEPHPKINSAWEGMTGRVWTSYCVL